MNEETTSTSEVSAMAAVRRRVAQFGQQFLRYRVVLFIAFVGVLYSFVAYQTYHLSNDTGSAAPSDSQTASLTPHVDQGVVKQLMSLKDNSVNVQALFNQSRTNPFSE